ncbi:MAG: 2,3-bisphosphoglycerate-independent phosphoglycerate mutase [Candidatus Asgardarchaeia archaeon]
MTTHRVLFIVLDGLGDLPSQELDYKTPLQYANTPSLDYLASNGITGKIDVIAPGIPPGSDSAHLSLFGYDPIKEYPGRGPFEAAGYGLMLKENEIAFRVNFGTAKKEGKFLILKDRRAGRISGEEAKEISEAIKEVNQIDDVEIFFAHTLEHRGILVLKGDNLSHEITDVDPHSINVPVLKSQPLITAKNKEAAKKTADIVNKWVKKTYEILKDHPINIERERLGKLPANVALPRGAGKKFDLESFSERWGFKPAAIAAGPLYKGVARVLGFHLINVPGATGLPNTDVHAKIKYALDALESYDFLFVHIKGTDTLSHKKDALGKAKFIEKVDKAIGSLLLPYLEEHEDLTVLITGDHTTASKIGHHTGHPVPILIFGPNVIKDEVNKFDEYSTQRGGLGRIRGRSIMNILLAYTDRALEYGLKPSPTFSRYIPHDWNGLEL